jgi:hypothetical protein
MAVSLITNEETTFVYDEAWVHLMIGLTFYFCLTYVDSNTDFPHDYTS